MTHTHEISVLFVCLGNICRSPLAEGVLSHQLEEAGIADQIYVDSAGTGAWHVGQNPDTRSILVAKKNGVNLSGLARQLRFEDFFDFQLILAMDRANLQDLKKIESDIVSEVDIRLFREFDPLHDGDLDVPDPYYGGSKGFDQVFEITERTCAALADYLHKKLT
jgi:protein-tyrosine phosphatase